MTNEYRKAFAEVDCILSYLSQEERNKIPEKLRKLIRKEKSKKYVYEFDPLKPYKEQNFSKETEAILAILYEKFIKD